MQEVRRPRTTSVLQITKQWFNAQHTNKRLH